MSVSVDIAKIQRRICCLFFLKLHTSLVDAAA